MKGAGALLVMASCLYYCGQICQGKRLRIRELRGLIECLEHMLGELELRGASTPELLGRMCELSEGETGVFFHRLKEAMSRLGEESFSLLWRETAAQALRFLHKLPVPDMVSPGELDEMIRAGAVLGRLDLEAQLRTLRFLRGVLQNAMEDERRSFPLRRKLLYGLCACGGLFLIVLIL